MKTAVQFGAGNIGRGFMGQLFCEAGLRTVFVETDRRLAQLLVQRGRYTLRLLDAYSRKESDTVVSGVTALVPDQVAEVTEVLARAEVTATAVGMENLGAVAPLIAAAVHARRAAAGGPLDVYLCENSSHAAAFLRDAVMAALDPSDRPWAAARVGFAGTSVARMVPAPGGRFGSSDPLFVAADSYHRLPYDGNAVKAPRLPIEGMYPVANFKAELERKLYTHNLGHAALGYLGWLKGCTYVHEPFDDPELLAIFTGALRETAQALVKMYPGDIDARGHQEILEDVNVRFSNPLLLDTVARVARDPLRKLAPGDRLIGSAGMCLAQGVFPAVIGLVCGAAFRYDNPDDTAAQKLQRLIRERGIEETLAAVSGVDPESALGRQIVSAYRDLAGLQGRHGSAPP